MTADKEYMYWHTNRDWYEESNDKYIFKLTDKAPERARKSFEMWKRANNFD